MTNHCHLIVQPTLPFVTAHNAHDLLMTVMAPHVAIEEGQKGISPALIRLAARHVADMRTMWSIRNEFEVHLDRLMTSAEPMMPGITEDVIQSLVLLRATSPAAYETIRLGASPLDELTQRWIDLVEANLRTQTDTLTRLRTELEAGTPTETRALKAGQALDEVRPELMPLAPYAQQVQYNGPVYDDDLANADGWQRIANGDPLQVLVVSGRPGYTPSRTNFTLGPQMLARLIGMPIDPTAWHQRDIDELQSSIIETEGEISFLRYHSWEQLAARTDLTVAAVAEDLDPNAAPQPALGEPNLTAKPRSALKVTFRDLIERYAPTPLAADLIVHGFLPRHFGRYSSSFYGGVVGVEAAEYLARAVEVGAPIIEYALDQESVAQVLAEQHADRRDDADFFDELSVYNLDIVAYLVNNRPRAASNVARHLAKRWGQLERQFVDRFFQRQPSDVSSKLAALMAPTWTPAVRYTVVDCQLPPETRSRLVDAVLGAIGDDHREDLDTEVGRYLTANHADLPVVIDPPDSVRADIVMGVIAEAEGTIEDLAVLKPLALEAAAKAKVYPVNAQNLVALGGANAVALDVLRNPAGNHPTYEHFMANLTAYLDAIGLLEPPGEPILAPDKFTNVLDDVAAAHQSRIVGRFVEATSDECRVDRLQHVAVKAWPALMSQSRTDATFENVQLYLGRYGVDEPIALFLSSHKSIEPPPEEVNDDVRLTVAKKILEARTLIPMAADRVALAASVEPGVIPISEIEGIDGALVGPMLEAGLLDDDEDAFDPRVLSEWKDFEAAVARSSRFGEFADNTTLPARRIVPVLGSSAVPEDTKAALITRLKTFLMDVTQAEATAIAQALAKRADKVDLENLEALRDAGASKASLVRLMVTRTELPVEDLVEVLRGMGGDYARLASGGSGVVHLDVDPDHRVLLDRLDGVTHTGAHEAFAIGRGQHLRANLKRTSMIGG